MRAFIESIGADRICRFRCSAGTGSVVIAKESLLPRVHDYCTMELDITPTIVIGENGQVVDAIQPAIECDGPLTRLVVKMESHDDEVCFARLSADCLLMLEVDLWESEFTDRYLRIEENAANLVAWCML